MTTSNDHTKTKPIEDRVGLTYAPVAGSGVGTKLYPSVIERSYVSKGTCKKCEKTNGTCKCKKKCCNTICNKCRNDEACLSPLYSDLRKLQNRISQTINNESEGQLQYINWGYGCFDKDKKKKLRLISKELENLQKAYYYDYKPCYDKSQIQKLIGIAEGVVGKCGKKDSIVGLTIDKSSVNLQTNCLPYEAWERAMFVRVPSIMPQVEVKQCLRLLFELKGILTENKLYPRVVAEIGAAAQELCKIESNITASPVDNLCRLEHNLLAKEKNCKLSLDQYTKLKNCGLSYDAISGLYECGVAVAYNEMTNEYILVGERQYPLHQLSQIIEVKNKIV